MRWRILLSGSAAPFLCEIQIAFLCDLRTREFCCEIALIECTCTEEGGGRKRGRDEGNEGGRGSFARCPIRLADANVARKKRLNQNFKIYFRGTVLEEKHNKEGTEIKKKKARRGKSTLVHLCGTEKSDISWQTTTSSEVLLFCWLLTPPGSCNLDWGHFLWLTQCTRTRRRKIWCTHLHWRRCSW